LFNSQVSSNRQFAAESTAPRLETSTLLLTIAQSELFATKSVLAKQCGESARPVNGDLALYRSAKWGIFSLETMLEAFDSNPRQQPDFGSQLYYLGFALRLSGDSAKFPT
jgi:hypothetical protein